MGENKAKYFMPQRINKIEKQKSVRYPWVNSNIYNFC